MDRENRESEKERQIVGRESEREEKREREIDR